MRIGLPQTLHDDFRERDVTANLGNLWVDHMLDDVASLLLGSRAAHPAPRTAPNYPGPNILALVCRVSTSTIQTLRTNDTRQRG